MNNESAFSTKLAAYSAMSGATLLGAGSTFGQNVIQYTDVDPDITLEMQGDLFNLDLDADGTTDFVIYKYFSAYPYIFSTASGSSVSGTILFNHLFALPATGNAMSGSYGYSGYPYPFALNAGQSVSNASQMIPAGLQSLVYSRYYSVEASGLSVSNVQRGNWLGGKTDKYLGLQFMIGEETHYGWVRLDVAADHTTCTIKDYAYNTIPDMAIATGQNELVPVLEYSAIGQTEIYSFGQTVVIQTPEAPAAEATVHITGIQGQVVFSGNLVPSGMQIHLDQAAAGVYLVQVETAGFRLTRKVFIE